MNKVIVTIICIIVIVGAVFTANVIYNSKNKNEAQIELGKVQDEYILDECTEEYEEIKSETTSESSYSDEKISPNCNLCLKKYYKKCNHTIKEYIELPKELVNLGKEQLQQKYNNWQIEKFTSNEITLYREFDGECGQHYCVKIKDNKIIIYQILESGEEVEFEKTEIPTEYLIDEDKEKLEQGIRVNGKEELNQYIENFE